MSPRRLTVLTLVLAGCGGGGDAGGDDGPSFADEHPRIFLAANRDRLAAELAAKGPAAARFQSVVDRWVGGGDVYGFQAWNAALVGQLTGDARYCTAAVAAIDQQVRAAQVRIDAGDAPAVASDSYLDVGEIIGDLALVYDWCFPAIAADRRGAWLGYANQAVWNVWNHDKATWGGKQAPWSGWATDDPSNNYYSSFLRATMLLGLAAHDELPGVADWLVAFHDLHLAGELVPTFETDLVGGGSREGTGYGPSMRRLFELYDLWHASTGETLATRTAHTRASMLAMIHTTVPTLDRVAPTGDHARDSSAAFFDYHRNYLQELISLFPGDPVAPRAQALLAASSVPKMENQFMCAYDFLYANPGVAPSTLDGLGTAYHAPGTGQLYARSGWDEAATWVNLIAGPYTQSHAHQDQGSIMIYQGGWLVYDANIDSESGLRQEPDAHSLVRIVDGGTTVKQRTGTASKLVALHRGPGWLHASADLTPAYKGSAAVQKVERELVYIAPSAFVIYDRVTSRAGGQQVWQLAAPVAPAIAGTRATIAGKLTVERVAPAQASSAAVDLKAVDADFRGGFRLETTMPGGDQRYLHVLWVGGAVGSVAPETDGVTLTLAGGGAATVRFHRDAVGGSLVIGGDTTPLAAGVDPLPE